MIKHLPLIENGQGNGQKKRLLPFFCPHLSAYKVEEASRLLAVKDQRRDAAATFPAPRAVDLCPESSRGCKP